MKLERSLTEELQPSPCGPSTSPVCCATRFRPFLKPWKMQEVDLDRSGLYGRRNGCGEAGLTEITRSCHPLRCELCRERHVSRCVARILALQMALWLSCLQADSGQPTSTRTTRETPPSRTRHPTTKSHSMRYRKRVLIIRALSEAMYNNRGDGKAMEILY